MLKLNKFESDAEQIKKERFNENFELLESNDKNIRELLHDKISSSDTPKASSTEYGSVIFEDYREGSGSNYPSASEKKVVPIRYFPAVNGQVIRLNDTNNYGVDYRMEGTYVFAAYTVFTNSPFGAGNYTSMGARLESSKINTTASFVQTWYERNSPEVWTRYYGVINGAASFSPWVKIGMSTDIEQMKTNIEQTIAGKAPLSHTIQQATGTEFGHVKLESV